MNLIDLDRLHRDWQLWTGRQVSGEGIPERVRQARLAEARVADALPSLIEELKQFRAFEERVEYGHQTLEVGWVPEIRGINYATHQRTLRYCNGEPLLIDHWTDPGNRKPFDPQPAECEHGNRPHCYPFCVSSEPVSGETR